MDAKDRLFADIALRLQLLTREQLAVCSQQLERSPGKKLCETAVELGLLSSAEAELCRAQRERALERQQQKPRVPARGGVVALVEEAPRRRDPRSASGPPPRAAAERSAAPRRNSRAPKRSRSVAPDADDPRKARKRGPREWEAPTRPDEGLVRAASAAVTPAQGVDRDLLDLSDPSVPIEISDTTPDTVDDPIPQPVAAAPRKKPQGTMLGMAAVSPAQPTPGQEGWTFNGFPPGQGEQIALASEAPAPAAPQRQPSLPQRAPTVFGPGAKAPPRSPAEPAAAPMAPASSTSTGAAQAPAAPEPVADESQPPARASAQRPAAARAPQDSYLGKALTLAIRHGASDLHVHSGAPLLMRVDGQLRPLSGTSLLNPEAAEKVIAEITNDAQWAELAKKGEVDFACELPGRARFRVNAYRQQRGIDAVFRIIPLRPPTLETLGLPARLARLIDFRTGMVLCTGPAGCGKSTTLAALLNALVQARADHVLTIEDPVEFVFPQARALCNQRQIGEHTGSFARALRAALREDPDVIAITELRDRETISLAMTAAETGHLVLGTLHTGNATQTIHRIVSSFPAEEQEQVRVMLAESLRAVVSQRLVPMSVGRGRVPAVELLMVTTAVSNLIREDKTHQLPSVMQTGKAAGMMTLDDSLDELVSSGVISADAARRVATRKERFG